MNHPHVWHLLMIKGWQPPTEAAHPHCTLVLLRSHKVINMQNHERGDVSLLFPSRQKKNVCIKHFEQKFTEWTASAVFGPSARLGARQGSYHHACPEIRDLPVWWCVTLKNLLLTRRQHQEFFSFWLRMSAISAWHRAVLADGLTCKSWVEDKINTYQCSPRSIHKCSLLLGSDTTRCSRKGWSSRGQSPSHSSRLWSLEGIGTAAHW